MKYLIGIADATRCPLMGSLTMAVVVVDPNFFRKFASAGIKDKCHYCDFSTKMKHSKLLSKEKRDKIVALTSKHTIWHRAYLIKPSEIDDENLNDLEAKAILELLNSFPEFWNHKIFIDNFDHSKEKFIERISKFIPHNLKLQQLDMDKWTVEHKADVNHKVVSLASIYAKAASDAEYDDIRKIWGDFGSGNPGDEKTLEFIKKFPNCPHIRKSWSTYQKLADNGELNGHQV